MPDYRVEFAEEVWTINIKAKKGRKKEETHRTAFDRAVSARAAKGVDSPPYDEKMVQKFTPQLRAALKGMTYLTGPQMLATCLSVGREYQQDALALTLRGMYYQLVSRGYLPSGDTEYNRVKSLLSKSRLKGDFPLGLLSDSSRTLHVGDATRYDLDVPHALTQAESWIPQLDKFFVSVARWYRQPHLPIVLYEKEALSNIFGPTCRERGVSWMATKGNPSLSTIYELHQLMARSVDPEILARDIHDLNFGYLQLLDPNKKKPTDWGDSEYDQILEGHECAIYDLVEALEGDGYWTEQFPDEDDAPHEHSEGTRYRYRYGDLSATELHQGTVQRVELCYFGDHDPNGMDIPLDLERRLRIIQVRTGQIIPFKLTRLGLNQDQIQQYNPPPFAAKKSSSLFRQYAEKYPWTQGRAWELDALDPKVLRRLVQDEVDSLFDQDIHDMVQDAVQEARGRFNDEMQARVLPSLINP